MIAENDQLTITVTRRSQLMDRTLPMDVVINGHRAGFLKNGQTETFYIPGHAQRAQLQAFLSMNKTTPIDIDPTDADTKEFIVQSTMTDSVFIIGTVLVIISTVLSLFTEQWLYMLIAAPPALYHLYLRFVLKDKYLTIREIERKATDQLPIR